MTAAAKDEPSLPADLSGPGERLRTAREKAGISVADVASRLRLDGRVIEALEAERFDALPAATFVRGYLRGYARLLGLAPEPLIDAFEREGLGAPPLVADIGLKNHPRTASATDLPIRLVTYLIAAGLVALVVVWWRSQKNEPFTLHTPPAVRAPQTSHGAPAAHPATPGQTGTAPGAPTDLAAPAVTGTNGAAPPAASAPRTTASAPQKEPGAAPPTTAASGTDTGTGGATAAAGTAAAPTAPTAQQPANATPAAGAASTPATAPGTPGAPTAGTSAAATTGTPAPTPAVPTTTTPQTPATGELKLSFAHDSWVEVYDAAGKRLFYGTARAGQDLDLKGAPPLRVVLGYASGVKVEYNAKVLNYASFVNRGIARFDIGQGGLLSASPNASASGTSDATQ